MDHNFSPLQVKEHLTSALAREPNFSLLVIGYSLGRMCSKQDANIIFSFPHCGPGAGLAQLVTAQLLEGPEASLVSGAKVRNIRMSKWLARHNLGW